MGSGWREVERKGVLLFAPELCKNPRARAVFLIEGGPRSPGGENERGRAGEGQLLALGDLAKVVVLSFSISAPSPNSFRSFPPHSLSPN